jgi:hypothetical protein
MSALPDQVTQPLPSAIRAKLPTIEDGEYSILFDTAKFEQAYRVARLFSASEFVPEAYRGKPENCFLALQMSTRLRVDPMMFMQRTYIVHGRPGMEATLVIALVNARGPFTGPIQWSVVGEGMDKTCTAYATHKVTGEVCKAECSMRMAEAEGWIAKSGSKWKTLPDMMLRYRSAAFLARLYAPECIMGLSTVDELDDITVDGEVDVTPRVRSSATGTALLKEIVAGQTRAEKDHAPASQAAQDDPATGRAAKVAKKPATPPAPSGEPAAASQGGGGSFPMTVIDALACVAKGDIDMARDIVRSLSATDQQRVDEAITSKAGG